MHEFDKTYWEDHWTPDATHQADSMPVNPYLETETAHLPVGSALDAGCGTGTEAIWLAQHGWQVTGADISAAALATAADKSAAAALDEQLDWVETDVARWEPDRTWDLVVTNYAHPDTGQLALYQRIASWVAPGGTLLIVGHLHGHNHGGSHDHPEEATATLAGMTGLFSAPQWHIESSYEHRRTVHGGGHDMQLHDVVVRVYRAA